MKHIISLIAFLLITIGGFAQVSGSATKNYIHTITYKTGVQESALGGVSDNDKIETISYFDGLGRPIQSVAVRQGGKDSNGDDTDIITPITYDAFGRQVKEYLPLATDANNGRYHTDPITGIQNYYHSNFSDDFPTLNAANSNPYSEKALEASPLNRVLKQAAPGEAWKLGNNHEIAFDYQANTATEVKKYQVNLSVSTVNNVTTYSPTLALSGSYAAGTLFKTITYDENHTSGVNHSTEEFKDKQGRVVLKRTYNNSVAHDTYYVYDTYGNLSYVLPPKAEPHTALPDATELSELCYQYKYDDRNRLVEKKIPGKGWEYIVYNKLDQPIMTQDANLDAQNQWLFTKYDAFGRVAYTGLVNSSSSRTVFQNAANTASSTYVTKQTSSTTLAGTAIYYNNGAYPTSFSKLYTINYYDDYTFDKDGLSLPSANVYNASIINHNDADKTKTKGLPTGTKVRVLDTNNWITTITGYDTHKRPIWVGSKNNYLSTTDYVESKLDDIIGWVDETKTRHIKSGTTTTTIDKFTYDHSGKVLTHTNKINSLPEQSIAVNAYDDLGQLNRKKVGGLASASELQVVDYNYNIRGWLKGINDVNNLGSIDLFGFKINYNTVDHSGTKLYNGNIAETEWKTANTDNSLKWYKYSYDALNRISSAYDNTGRYDVFNITYDKNGNIQTLKRDGKNHGVNNTYGLIDNLTYAYETNSNKLKNVNDSAIESIGFTELANNATEYSYDNNGNMLRDNNKGINSDILYNHLNLPTKVYLPTGNISYIYDAVGTKLKKIVSTGTTTEYAGNYVYENGSLKFFNHPEGYVDVNGSNYSYVYQYKDHLGNVRLSYQHDDSVTSVNVDDDFNSGTDGWPQPSNASYLNNNSQKLNLNLLNKWNGTSKYTAITPNIPLHIEFDFEKGNMSNPYLVVRERVNGVWQTSSQTVLYLTADNHYELDITYTGDYVRLLFEKGVGSDDGTMTTCYVDNFKVTQNGIEILEENNYYPFGLRHKGYNNVVNSTNPALKYKYNGKELNDELGLNMYDYGARFYDPALGKWFTPDAMAEKYYDQSVYTYTLNNPILFVDPDGNQVAMCCEELKAFLGRAIVGINQGHSNFVNNTINGAIGLGARAVSINSAVHNGEIGQAVSLTGSTVKDAGEGLVTSVTQPIEGVVDIANGNTIEGFAKVTEGVDGIAAAIATEGIGRGLSAIKKTGKTKIKSSTKPYTSDRKIGNDPKTGKPIIDSEATGRAHTQIGIKTSSNQRVGNYSTRRTIDSNGTVRKQIDYTDHGRPQNHTNPHTHNYHKNKNGQYKRQKKEKYN